MTSDEGPSPATPVGVVVVNYGSSALVRRNLAGRPWPDSLRVVVVDNRTSDDEAAALASLCEAEGFHLVPLAVNAGFAGGCNAGVAAAVDLGCTAVVLLNPDASADPAVLVELGRQAQQEPDSLIAPRVVDPQRARSASAARVSLADGRIRTDPSAALDRPEAWLSGACLALSTQLHTRLGGVPDGYFLYWEDVELSHRCLAAGGRLVVREDLEVRHESGGTQGERRGPAKSALYYRWNIRNRLVFAARNLPRRDVVRWLLATPAVSWEILLRGGRRQLVHDPRLLLAAGRGLVGGVLQSLPALITGPRLSRRVLVAHPGAELYGSDRVLLDTVAGLVEAGDHVTVTVPGPGPLVAELQAVGARVVHCRVAVVRKELLRPAGALRACGDALAGLLPAARLLLTAGRDGVLVNTVTVPSWALLARLLGRRVVCHVHEAEVDAPMLLRRALTLPAVLSHDVVVNSVFSQSVLAEAAPATAGRAEVVLNAVPVPEPATPAREHLHGPVRLLFVGRLSPRKGPDVAVKALAELCRRGLAAELTLVGDIFPGYEWFAEELRAEVAEAGLVEQVTWSGFRPHVWPALAAADVVLVPSQIAEPFGNTAVEASASGRPVVVSNTGGLPEAVHGRGSAQLVPPADIAAWADAVERVVADWPAMRAAAAADAPAARADFSPRRFRRDMTSRLHRSWDRARSTR